MKAPHFWANPPDRPGWQARLLSPLASIWQGVTAKRLASADPEKVGVPVLCIGNLTAGGTGKTPMVAALMERLSQHSVTAHVVTRGYGGSVVGPHLVDPTEDSAAQVGDEPLLLAAHGLVWVAKDRVAGARAAVAGGAKLILLDDGFQNPALHKDAAILMVDAGAGFGNGQVIPAGPLREPVASGLDRADLVVLLGSGAHCAKTLAQWPVLQHHKVLEARLEPVKSGLPLRGEPVVAFAGIGRPEKFFDTLRELGAELISTHALADHADLPPQLIRRMLREARGRGAMVVTTEKDAVRLPPRLRAEILTVMVRLEPTDWGPVDDLVFGLLGSDRERD